MAEYELTKLDITQPYKGVKAVKIGDGDVIFLDPPTKVIRVENSDGSCNKVMAYYGNYLQTITADGTGNERYNFKSTVSEMT